MKRGLGRGLGVLLGQNEEEYERAMERSSGSSPVSEKAGGEQPTEVSISKIDPNINQPRKKFDETALMELANSIRIHGVISPIIVVRTGDRYMIIAGERRYRACKKIGLATVPVLIREYTPKQVKEISLIDNLQREDLNPIETASAIKQLMDEYSYTQEQVAEQVGKSRPYIANTLRLLLLSHAVIDYVATGRLSAGHARCLVVVEDKEAQINLAKTALDDKVSVRDFEKTVKQYLNPDKAKAKPQQSIELKELIANMQRAFKTKVSALGSDQKGRIFIDYYTRDDLDRLAEIVNQIVSRETI
ncbi:MAG: ParB/RepB/Spo0J family partition protein [Firmicutes bacterium]|nr:ParB/RepB/Spo0J family partition protein [Bacillota bacterium]